MRPLRLYSAVEQVTQHLREELNSRLRDEVLPGVNRLAAELGVNHKTVEAAVKKLEQEGLLQKSGPRRSRLIRPSGQQATKSLRVVILPSQASVLTMNYMVELRHELLEAGHAVDIASRSLGALRLQVQRVARFVQQTDADAWVVQAGTREVLEWFSTQAVPVFALFGRFHGLPIAAGGADKLPALIAAVRALSSLGHRRIVLMIRPRHRSPQPGIFCRAFLDELAACGIQAGAKYNLPDWEESREGFLACLANLFAMTPPTALIIDEAKCFAAAHHFLAGRGLRVPQDVSLVCTDDDPTFVWCEPSIAHMSWNPVPVVRGVVRWAAHVGSGQLDVRQSLTKAKFVSGGTIGPAPVAVKPENRS